jgi:hypothetical protein
LPPTTPERPGGETLTRYSFAFGTGCHMSTTSVGETCRATRPVGDANGAAFAVPAGRASAYAQVTSMRSARRLFRLWPALSSPVPRSPTILPAIPPAARSEALPRNTSVTGRCPLLRTMRMWLP